MSSSEIPNSTQRLAMDESDDLSFPKRCFFSWFTCAAHDRSFRRVSCFNGGCWERVKKATEEPEQRDKWWVKGWKRIREWSELVAGPRWKTFIRRLNQENRNRGRYQYDALSYALNFDEGGAVRQPEHAVGNFSAQLAPPLSAKSLDFHKESLFPSINEEEDRR